MLWVSAGFMGTGAIGSVLWATRSPDKQWLDNTFIGSTSPTPARDSGPTLSREADFAHLANLDLRRPLHDPPPPASPPMHTDPPLNIRLAGVVLEIGHNQALIAIPDGSVQLKGVGESVGDALIQDIGKDHIMVRYLGHSQIVSLSKEGGG